jgi:hypothetical protein|tara:strand:- start:552 stop:746 length:195 start_codon:yes stop_codon:yes gene_type:complete
MTSKERMKSWENLPEPRPTWELWKSILSSKGHDLGKAKEQWKKIADRRSSKSFVFAKKKLDKQG